MTKRATIKPTPVGVAIRRQVCASSTGPSNQILVQSIARRKHTTARPENSPMKTASRRKKRSSRVLLRVNHDRLPGLGISDGERVRETGSGSLGAAAVVIVPLPRGPGKEGAEPDPHHQ